MPFDDPMADPLAAIIGDIYEAPREPDKWHRAMQNFVTLSGARVAFLAIVDEHTGALRASSVVGSDSSKLDDAMELYRTELVAIDPGFRFDRTHGGRFAFDDTDDRLSDDPDGWREFIRNDFGSGNYHTWISPTNSDLSVGLALHTPPEQTAITARQQQLHATVFSHLDRAAQLAARPPRLSQTRSATIMVNTMGGIVDASPQGEAVLSLQDGLKASQGHLAAAAPDEHRQLLRHIRQTCDPATARTAQSWLAISRDEGQQGPSRPWLLHFEPVPLLDLGMDGGAFYCAIRIAGSVGSRSPDLDALRAMFDLTAREAQMAVLMAETPDDLPAIAHRLNIAYETARTHSRNVLAKTGAANRIALVRLLADYR